MRSIFYRATTLAAALVFSVSAWAQFSTTMTSAQIQAEVAKQLKNGVKLADVLKAAQAANLPVQLLAQAVMGMATTQSAAQAVLTALSTVYAANPTALQTVFDVAVTTPVLALSPEAVATAIATTTGDSTLSASLVTNSVVAVTTVQTAPLNTADTSNTVTNSTNCGVSGC